MCQPEGDVVPVFPTVFFDLTLENDLCLTLPFRLEVAEALASRVDAGLQELLRAHVEDIRQEASDYRQDSLLHQAERLLKKLDADN